MSHRSEKWLPGIVELEKRRSGSGYTAFCFAGRDRERGFLRLGQAGLGRSVVGRFADKKK